MKREWRHVAYRVRWFEHGSTVATSRAAPTLDDALDEQAKLIARGISSASIGIYREQVLA